MALPKEPVNNYFEFKNIFLKTASAVLMLMVILLSLNFSGAKKTFAIFNDSGSAPANNLVAGTLDFTANSDGELSFNFKPGEVLKKKVLVANNGTLNFQYNVVLENNSGSGDLCGQLITSVDLDGLQVYSGNLIDFTSGDIIFTPTEDRWAFSVSLPTGTENLENKTCQFKFIFNGWQDNLSSGLGFTDIENVQSNFQADYCGHSNGNNHNHHPSHKNKGGEDEDDDDENNEGDCERHNNHNGGGGHNEDEENDKYDSKNSSENLILNSASVQQEEASSTQEPDKEKNVPAVEKTDNQPPTETAEQPQPEEIKQEEQPPQPPVETPKVSDTKIDTPTENITGA